MNNKTLTTVLNLASSAGTIVTAYLVAKETKKLLDDRTPKEFELYKKEVTKKELFKTYLKTYWPAIAVGSASIAMNLTGTVVSNKTQASLLAAATLADQGWRKYKDKIKETLGIVKHEEAMTKISQDEYPKLKQSTEDGRMLYWEEHVGYFYAYPEKLALAFADLNQRIQIPDFGKTDHYSTVWNLITDSEADLLNPNIKGEDINWGWSNEYLGETYGYPWIHMNYETVVMDDGGKYNRIIFVEEPIFNPGNYGESFVGKEFPDDDCYQKSGGTTK